MASGSDDKDVKLWHIASRQCCRTLPHKGVVTATEFAMAPPPGCLDTTDTERFRPSLILAPFEKTLYIRGNKNKIDKNDDNYVFQTLVRERIIPEDTVTNESYEVYEPPRKTNRLEVSENSGSSTNDTVSAENDKLKEINLELYQYAVAGILGDRNIEPKA